MAASAQSDWSASASADRKSTTAYLALGGNLGDKAGFIARALEYLRAEPGIRLIRHSANYTTAPVGCPPDSPEYLNAVAEVQTAKSPAELLATCLEIERRLGRIRPAERNASRTIDLDVLLYGNLVQSHPDPIVPHPRLPERAFVLTPLSEIAGDFVHPILEKTIRQLLAELPSDGLPPRREEPIPAPFANRNLFGKRAMVTGSSSGIGAATATELAKAGADLILHGRRDASAMVDSLRQFGGRVEYLRADLAQPAEQDRLFGEAWPLYSGLDIWVHNAGADTLTGEAAQWPFERKLQELLAVDLVACMRMTRMAGDAMAKANGGSIITIGWDQAASGMAGDSGQLFAAVKGAIHSYTKSLAKSLAPRVRVNCVAPGWIRTAWGETASASWQERVRSESLMARWGLPEDIARMVRFLVSEEAGYVNGQVVEVNGGVA